MSGRGLIPSYRNPLSVYLGGPTAAKNAATLAATIAALPPGAATLFLEPGTWTIDANLTLPTDLSIWYDQGAILQVADGVTLTHNSRVEADQKQQIFSLVGSGAVVLGNGQDNWIYYWGATIGAGADIAAGWRGAILSALTGRGAVRMLGGQHTLASDVAINGNFTTIKGAGPLATVINYTGAGTALQVTTGAQREHTLLEGFTLTCDGLQNNVALNLFNAPNTTVRDVFVDSFRDAVVKGSSWNCTFVNFRAFSIRRYGVDASANANTMAFVGCTLDGTDAAGSRGLRLESCHSVTWCEGAIEDFEWGVDSLGETEFTFDGYIESCSAGGFLATGNETYFKINRVYAFNPGATALFRGAASASRFDVGIVRLLTPTVNPAFVFDLSGASSALYSFVRADEAQFEPGGAAFQQVATGSVLAKGAPTVVTNPFSNQDGFTVNAATLLYAAAFNNPAGNGGVKIQAGNNKVNDGSEYLINAMAGDGTGVMRVQSGGLAEILGRLITAQGADVASAADITLGIGNYFDITGAAVVDRIASANWSAGSLVTLQFDGAATLSHGVAAGGGFAGCQLAGAANFVASAGDTISLRYDGTWWREVSRAVI